MATIFIYDEIGDPAWGLIGPQTIADELSGLADDEPLLVRINSPGGSVFDALAIRELLSDHAGEKSFKIDALAASAATFLPTDGAPVEISSAGRFMIHSPWTLAFGNAAELRKLADELDSIEGDITDIYERRVDGKTSREDITSMLAEETMMSAVEAREAGFVDSISESSQKVAACWRPGLFSKELDELFAQEPTVQPAAQRKEKAKSKAHRGPNAVERERVARMKSSHYRELIRRK